MKGRCVMSKRRTTLADIEAAINRWETRLFRSVNALRKLRQQRKRIVDPAWMKECDSFLAEHPRPADATVSVMGVKVPIADEGKPLTELPPEPADDLAIPTFLKRSPADVAAAAEIKAGIENRKAAKARANAAKRKAQAKGELRKMPLQGAAALAYIAKAT